MLQLALNLEPLGAGLTRPHSLAPSSQLPVPSPELPVPSSQPPVPSSQPPAPVFVFVRHAKARRYLIRVTEEGIVRVTIPRRGSQREAAAFAAREQTWIEKQLQRVRVDHERRERERHTAHAEPGTTNDEGQRDAIVRAKRELPPRLLELAARHGLTVSRVSIRNQRWRWGSCSRSGHICLNWRLVTMPAEVRDYVLIHELMHLKRMDHSPKFWKLVADACPAYKDARAWLRSHRAR